jgi:aspartate--ammonia ligase
LNGVERPVSFAIKDLGGVQAEVVHSLAKWKRMALARHNILPGKGLYTDMNAIRADEELDNIHSLYVDQWDWERVMLPTERNLDFLKYIVCKIYEVIKRTEVYISHEYPIIEPILPENIRFFHAEELEEMYPQLSPKERENKASEEYGAIFIIGIGYPLKDGKKHDGRAPDYDDWSTLTEKGYHGLNGDIIIWNPILKMGFELSSMGIRVDKESLLLQLAMTGEESRKELLFHHTLLTGGLPQTIGGGIGQSRLCMFYLRKAHIGEIQSSIWPLDMIQECSKNNIILL